MSCRPPPALTPTFVFEIATPLSAMPGASWKVPLKVRASGSFSIVLRVVTTETSLDLVSTSGAAAMTVTTSAVVARRTG